MALVFSLVSPVLGIVSPAQAALTDSNCTPSISGLTASGTATGSDCVITFTAGSGTWSAPASISSYTVFVVGGGGGGGFDAGGGGGGGATTEGTINLSTQTNRSFSVTVGTGGLRSVHTANDTRYSTDSANMSGTNGNPSTIAITDSSSQALSVQANGGNKGAFGLSSACCAAGGGGGTVAITDNSSSLDYTATVSSTGGAGGNGRNFSAAGAGFTGSGGYSTSTQFPGSYGGGAGGEPILEPELQVVVPV